MTSPSKMSLECVRGCVYMCVLRCQNLLRLKKRNQSARLMRWCVIVQESEVLELCFNNLYGI